MPPSRRCAVLVPAAVSGTVLPSGVYVERIVQARESRGMTRRECAVRLEIPLEQLRAIERGQADVDHSLLFRLCRGLDFPLAFFRHPIPEGARFDHVWMCGAGVERCSRCVGVGDYLCDSPTGGGRTCDLPLCERHRCRVAGEPDEPDDPEAIDYCPQHAAMARAAGGSAGQEAGR